jgi:predicted DNA-binding protein YlxM (UPF0122 family)
MNFTEEQVSIINEYYDGIPVTEIAQKRDLTREAIYLTLRKIENWRELKDFNRAKKKIKASNEDMGAARRAKELILSGKTVKEATKITGISRHMLYKYHPEMKNLSKQTSSYIAKDWYAGKTYAELCNKYDMQLSNIQRRIRDHYGDDWETMKEKRAKKVRRQRSSQRQKK